ncbi:hypothetical protein [Flavobacterium sp.]|uniref:hypothetical protein n=1 Tax=Flavobacterium sp. TaxID=239 RepID=UPI00375308AF
MYYFKDALISFLKNIRKLTYGGTEVFTNTENSQKDEKNKIDISTEGNDFSDVDKALLKFSNSTNEKVSQIIQNETKINDLTDINQKYDRIYNYSKLLIIIKSAEKIHHMIYGSQIRILQRLNHSITEKIEDLEFYYDNAAKYNPKLFKDYPYREYLNFLVINELVLMNENEQTLTITDMGKDFLRYIIESNLSSEKLN